MTPQIIATSGPMWTLPNQDGQVARLPANPERQLPMTPITARVAALIELEVPA